MFVGGTIISRVVKRGDQFIEGGPEFCDSSLTIITCIMCMKLFHQITIVVGERVRELSSFSGRGGASVCRGIRICGVVKGGDQNFFAHAKGGTRIFLRMQRVGPENIGDWQSQTDAPLPVKNDRGTGM